MHFDSSSLFMILKKKFGTFSSGWTFIDPNWEEKMVELRLMFFLFSHTLAKFFDTIKKY